MTDLRPLRIRVPEPLMRQAKQELGDPDQVSDTIVIRYALALLAKEDPALHAVHRPVGRQRRKVA